MLFLCENTNLVAFYTVHNFRIEISCKLKKHFASLKLLLGQWLDGELC